MASKEPEPILVVHVDALQKRLAVLCMQPYVNALAEAESVHHRGCQCSKADGVCLFVYILGKTQVPMPYQRLHCRLCPGCTRSPCHAQERFEDPEVVYVERAAAESGNGAAHAEAEHSGSEDGVAEHHGSASKVRCCCRMAVVRCGATATQSIAYQQRAIAPFNT